MRPSVAGDLMSLSNHARDDCRPRLALVINSAFIKINAGNKESSFGAICFELVEHVVGVNIRAIIVCNGNSVWGSASIDAFSTVYLFPELRTRSVACTASSGDLVGITARTVLEETVRCCAVVRCSNMPCQCVAHVN